MIYEEIFRAFEKEDVRYVVVGGVACNIYGYVRMTVDLDIMVDLSEENLSKIVAVMERLGYRPRAPVEPRDLLSEDTREEWVKNKGAVVFTFIDPKKPFRQVDIFLVNPMNFEEVHERREEMTVGGIRMAVVCMEDLIAMKSSAGRPRDFEDVDHLRKIAALRGGER